MKNNGNDQCDQSGNKEKDFRINVVWFSLLLITCMQAMFVCLL